MDKKEILDKICGLGTAITGEIKGDYIIVKSCDFTNISFASINKLTNVIFVDCKLVNVTFAHMLLESCTFIACDLTKSMFLNCELQYAVFLKTIGKEMSFRECDLDIVEFNDVRMNDVKLVFDKKYSYTINLYITSSVIADMEMINIDSDATIHIEYSYVNNANICGCCPGNNFIIHGTEMKNLLISNSDVCYCIIRDSDLSDSSIISDCISPICNNVNFSESVFRGNVIDSARFVNCDLSNVELDCTDIQNSTFNNCAMTHTDISGCYNITNTEFKSSKFIGTNMQQVAISDCDFSDCVMKNMNLDEAEFDRVTESSPNIIEYSPDFVVDGIKWDGIEIEDVDDDTSRGRSTLKNAIIKNVIRRQQL